MSKSSAFSHLFHFCEENKIHPNSSNWQSERYEYIQGNQIVVSLTRSFTGFLPFEWLSATRHQESFLVLWQQLRSSRSKWRHPASTQRRKGVCCCGKVRCSNVARVLENFLLRMQKKLSRSNDSLKCTWIDFAGAKHPSVAWLQIF